MKQNHVKKSKIKELRLADRETLGLRAIMCTGLVHRPLPGENLPRGARWVDALGLDSEYDYDPLWRRFVELDVTPTFHSTGMGWGSRTSPSSYVANAMIARYRIPPSKITVIPRRIDIVNQRPHAFHRSRVAYHRVVQFVAAKEPDNVFLFLHPPESEPEFDSSPLNPR